MTNLPHGDELQPNPPLPPRGTLFVGSDGLLRPIWRFAIATLLYFFATFAAGIIAYAFFRRDPLYFDSLLRPLATAFCLLLFWFLATRLDDVREKPFAYMGLGLDGPWLKLTLYGFVCALVGVIAIMLLFWWKASYLVTWNLAATPALRVLLTLWMILTAALLEEVVFRGYPFQRLCEAVGPVIATLCVSLLFGYVHMSNPNANAFGFVNTVLAGVVLSMAYLRTGSLWLPWGLHFGWNFGVGTIAGLPVSGLNDFSIFGRAIFSGPSWITGAAYGPEAGFSGTVGFAVAAALAILVSWRPTSKSLPQP